DQGWDGLKACIERTRWPRGEFTHLELITRGAWDRDLQSRPDAPQLIAKMIAMRGGDVEGDLAVAQKSRVPIFSLQAALRQPDVYKGRWVVMRGALKDIRQEAGKAAAMVSETSLRATSREVQVGNITRHESSSSMSARGEVQTSNYGSARGRAQIDSTGRSQSTTVG